MGRHELSDERYALLAPELPTNEGKVGRPWSDHRPIINGIFCSLPIGIDGLAPI
jgi:transposase